ncbi:hypothetical protein G9A89_019902 [Geosiphon pyriformis]|nr:hypothetical protein G9A89_019902 [Geosiphon pyriformis]
MSELNDFKPNNASNNSRYDLNIIPPPTPSFAQSYNDDENDSSSSEVERLLLTSSNSPLPSQQIIPQTPLRLPRTGSLTSIQHILESVRGLIRALSPSFQKDIICVYLKEACNRLLSFILILIVVFIALTFVKYRAVPSRYIYSDIEFSWPRIEPLKYLKPMNTEFGEINLLLDGHSHTTMSDGLMEPEMLLKWAIANGYDAIIVSDHNTLDGGFHAQEIARAKYNDTIIVIPAMEYSSCRIHMNLIGINVPIPVGPDFPSDEDLQKIIQRTHELGGLVSVNHIPWSNKTENWYQVGTLLEHPTREDLLEWGVDAFEIINGNTFDLQTYLFAKEHGLLMLTGSDVHSPSTGAYSWTTIRAPNKTMAGVMAELHAKRTSFLFDPTGTRPRAYPKDNPIYFKMLPITLLAEYWTSFYSETRGMYSFQERLSLRRVSSANQEKYLERQKGSQFPTYKPPLRCKVQTTEGSIGTAQNFPRDSVKQSRTYDEELCTCRSEELRVRVVFQNEVYRVPMESNGGNTVTKIHRVTDFLAKKVARKTRIRIIIVLAAYPSLLLANVIDLQNFARQ